MSTDKSNNIYMNIALEEAERGVETGEGGPFGAVIVQYKGKGKDKGKDKGKGKGKGNEPTIVARSHNMVLQTNDPTAHAEVTCIRKACAKLGRFDLSDCVIYSTCEPCPMCFGAIHWAKLPRCEYASTAEDASLAGFSDTFIYQAIRKEPLDEVTSHQACQFQHTPTPNANAVFEKTYNLY